VSPDDVLEDLARVLGGVERSENRVYGPRPDHLAALDQLDELVHDRAGLADPDVVALERETVATKEQSDAEAVSKRVEDAVVDRGELGRDLVGNRENFLQRSKFSEGGGNDRRTCKVVRLD
jgi:hypothetical protein